MRLKIFDLEAFLFRLNGIIITLVLILLAPTTNIIASWYPEKKDIYWLFPAIVLGCSVVLWIMMRFSLPLLIKWGIFEDRRQGKRHKKIPVFEKIWRILWPAIALSFQMSVLIFMCMCLIQFLRDGSLRNLFVNI